MTTVRFALFAGALAAIALACLAVTSSAQSGRVPVTVGGDPDYDACDSQGVVQGLDPQGDGFLAVRAGPGSGYAMLDKVHNGYILNVCDERGQWLGVVYSHETMDCGVSTPWPQARPYTGPCLSGWVYRKFVGAFAG